MMSDKDTEKGPPFASKWKDGPYELRLIPDGEETCA